MDVSPSVVSDFYTNRSILITGGTGFMGKVLIEKLLRACPKLNQIYVLIRSKKGKSASERMSEILEGPLFQSQACSSSDSLRKVIVISGDVTEQNLGISSDDMATIVKNVTVIFHIAATIKFDEKLAEAININVLGTIRVIEMARKLAHLCCLVHVSTAYSHCYLSTKIEEKFYPLLNGTCGSNFLDEITKIYRKAKLQGQVCTKDVIGVYPNTYTYTKGLAETYLEEYASDLPIAIIRPSIVTASWKEPFPGWIDGFNGPTGKYS